MKFGSVTAVKIVEMNFKIENKNDFTKKITCEVNKLLKICPSFFLKSKSIRLIFRNECGSSSRRAHGNLFGMQSFFHQRRVPRNGGRWRKHRRGFLVLGLLHHSPSNFQDINYLSLSRFTFGAEFSTLFLS